VRILELKGKKVAIWGHGLEAKAAFKAIRQQNSEMHISFLSDDPLEPVSKAELLRGKAISVVEGEGLKNVLQTFDIVIKSPGVSAYKKEIIEAKEKGVIFTSASNIWCAEHPQAKIIGITGTKGKSTTSALIFHLMRSAGLRVAIAGNIGRALFELDNVPEDYLIVEFSSYQAADFNGQLEAAVLLNLYPEHLDWHGGFENYRKDKLKLVSCVKKNGIVVLNQKDLVINAHDKSLQNRKVVYFEDENAFHVSDGHIKRGSQPLVPLKELPLVGIHNASNICAALTVVTSFGIETKDVIASLKTFSPLPHRLATVSEKNRMLFVNDSISTVPQAALAAVRSFPDRPITIILGGQDRGLNWSEFADNLLERDIFAAVCLPDSGWKIAEHLNSKSNAKINVHKVSDLKEAVSMAKSITPVGGVVLLSPASPSYGQFKNFEERGRAFEELVNES